MYVGEQIGMCNKIKREELERYVNILNQNLIQKILLEKQNE